MKKWLFLSALIVSLNAFSQSAPVLSSSSSEVGSSMKVFLCITHNDDAVSTTVRNTLTTMGGANTVAYCDKHSVFMVLVDKNSYQDETSFLNQVKKLSPGVEQLLSIKTGDFDSFVNNCEPSNPIDAKRLKNLATN